MTKDVLLSLRGLQFDTTSEDGDKIETITPAEYYMRNDSHYVMFEEAQEGFIEKTKGMLKIKKGSVELTKKGLIQSHMLFEKDLRYATEYKSPFGGFMMDVCTRRLNIAESEDEISMEIKYSLETNGQPVTDCLMKIIIKEK